MGGVSMKKGKALWLALSALTVVGTMAMAQAAFASHETVQSTNPNAGSVVPAAKVCVATGSQPNSQHGGIVAFPSCQKGTNNASSDLSTLLIGKPNSVTGEATGSGFTSSYTNTVVHPSNIFGGTDAVDVKVESASSGTFCEFAPNFITAQQVLNCGDDAGTPSGADSYFTGSGANGCADADCYVHGQFEGVTIGTSVIRATDTYSCNSTTDVGCAANPRTKHATVEDFDFSVPIDCVAGACNITTSADAQFGAVYDAAKDPTVLNTWGSVQLLGIRAQDPGPDGVAGSGCPLSCGTGDEKDAAYQGLWIN